MIIIIWINILKIVVVEKEYFLMKNKIKYLFDIFLIWDIFLTITITKLSLLIFCLRIIISYCFPFFIRNINSNFK